MERLTETRRAIQGVVVSNKNDKTITVLVETHRRHSKYGKRVKYRKKFYAHDEKNEANVGDTVTIMETRKLSATKRFRLVSIDKKAVLTVKEAEAELKEEALEVKAEKETVTEEVKVEEPVKEEKVEEVEAAPAKKPATRKASSTTKKTTTKKEEEK